jgi:hypothetical protein
MVIKYKFFSQKFHTMIKYPYEYNVCEFSIIYHFQYVIHDEIEHVSLPHKKKDMYEASFSVCLEQCVHDNTW